MKKKHTFFVNKDNKLKVFKTKQHYQIVEENLKKRKKECEENLSKFC